MTANTIAEASAFSTGRPLNTIMLPIMPRGGLRPEVSHEAPRDHADRMHFSGTDGAVFEAYRELIEEVASEAHDAEGPFDAHGRILVTSEALARVTRST